MEEIRSLSLKDILDFLPHRDPFLFVDRIDSIKNIKKFDGSSFSPNLLEGIEVVGGKNVTISEWFFRGHFPDEPIMPGVLSLELIAQVSAFSVYPLILEKNKNRAVNQENKKTKVKCIFMGAADVRFRMPIFPGDALTVKVVTKKIRSGIGFYEGKIFSNEKLAVEANITANIGLNF